MEDIQELFRRHDDYQIEIKWGYDLDRNRRKDLYTVEYFFFLPENLDVNRSTYSKKQFYRDMLLYLRFRAPDLSLDDLADGSDERSPLRKIREKLEAVGRDPSDRRVTVLEYELKLFACVLKDALADRLREVKRILKSGKPTAKTDAENACAATAQKAGKAAEGFRAFHASFQNPSLPANLRSAYAFADEYASILIEGYAHQMLRLLQDAGAGSDGLAGAVQRELDHRRVRGYPSLVEEGKDNETFVFRLGVLKKYTSSALHLSVRTEREGQGIDHIGMALGSGLAMVFYTAIAFYSQKVYGTLSLAFFVAVVVGYMFRDRIKAVAEAYFLRFRSDRVMDLATDLFDPATGEKIGECRELVHFVSESKVDPHVVRLRNREHITEIENTWRSENVLHYVKEIDLYPRRFDPRSRKKTVMDITRLHLRNFLQRMDQDRREAFILKDGRSETVPAVRVYHVNMVVKFTGGGRTRYERVRLVLTRAGIKRLEPVCGEVRPAS